LQTSLAKEDLLIQLDEETKNFRKFQACPSPPKQQLKKRKVKPKIHAVQQK
jgi:hypothetical protein